jgi:hypothetical protein
MCLRLYVDHQAGWFPPGWAGSRQRATELVQGAAGLPLVFGELGGSTAVRARPVVGEWSVPGGDPVAESEGRGSGVLRLP